MKKLIISILFFTLLLFSCNNNGGVPQGSSGGSSAQSFQEILYNASADGSIYWDVQATYTPAMSFKLRFLSNGTISGKMFEWNMVPEQEIAGYWQVDGDNLIINYSYNMANFNSYGQVVNWIPSTQNVTLRITGYSENRINAVAVAENGYYSNYSWFFSR